MAVFGFEGDNAREKVIVLLTMCFALAMVMLDNTVVNVALPAISEKLGAGVSGLQWIVDGYVLALASLLLTGGILGDRYGRKKMFLLGLTVFTLASFGCGVSGSTGALIAFRALAGRGRRAAPAGDAVDHHGHVPAARARQGDRPVGGVLGLGARARTHGGRRDGGAPRVAVDLLPQRADRDHRVPGRDADRHGVRVRGRAAAGHPRTGAGHGRPVQPDVRADRGEPEGLERPADRLDARGGRPPHRGVPLLGAPHARTR